MELKFKFSGIQYYGDGKLLYSMCRKNVCIWYEEMQLYTGI